MDKPYKFSPINNEARLFDSVTYVVRGATRPYRLYEVLGFQLIGAEQGENIKLLFIKKNYETDSLDSCISVQLADTSPRL